MLTKFRTLLLASLLLLSLAAQAQLVSTAPVTCYTDNFGRVVGVPDPLALPVLSTNLASGTLPLGVYYFKFAYVGAGGVSSVSPEANITLTAQGTASIQPPAIQPTSATGFYNVYVGTSSGAETLQATLSAWVQYDQATPLVAGAAAPSSNSSVCSVYFSDQIIPTGTHYKVGLVNKNGSQIAGFPQTWCTYGGAQGQIDVSAGAPTGNCGTNGVFYPTPIFAVPISGATQSISGNLNLTGPVTATGGFTATSGQNAVGRVHAFNNVLYVGEGITTWGGTDIGGQINSACASAPASGCHVIIASKSDGSCYDLSTTITATTAGKFLLLEGWSAGGQATASSACLNWTPTSGHMMDLDFVPLTGRGRSTTYGLRNLRLTNGGSCTSIGGCGSSALAIVIGTSNAGIDGAIMENVAVQGFNEAYHAVNISTQAAMVTWVNPKIYNNSLGFQLSSSEEWIIGGIFSGNATHIHSFDANSRPELHSISTVFLSHSSFAFDFNATTGSPALLFLTDPHLENGSAPSNTVVHYLRGDVDVFGKGGIAEDDDSGSGTSADWWFQPTGNTFEWSQLKLITAARNPTTAVLNLTTTTRALFDPFIANPGTLTSIVAGTGAAKATYRPLNGNTATAALDWQLESRQQAPRFIAAGTALTTGDFAISAGWGATATKTNAVGSDGAFRIQVNSSGGAEGASPTITLTFHDGAWTVGGSNVAPFCSTRMVSTTDAATQLNLAVTDAPTATTDVITFNGTPADGKAFTLFGFCIGKLN